MKFKLYEEWLSNRNVNDPVDSIKWGNQTLENKMKAESSSAVKKWFLDNPNVLYEIINSAPQNSSSITRNDLETLVDLTKQITDEQLKFALEAEYDHLAIWEGFIAKHKLNTTRKDLEKIQMETDPLIFYLKNLINRPRPWQLAYYLGIELYPLMHTNANSASYPSGHGFDAILISKLLSQKYPNLASEIAELGEKILASREWVGVHYPSDTDAARQLATIVISEKIIEL